MDALSRLTAPASATFRHLQKIVQDIKKHDGSILDKLRRLKSKPVPKIPARDYRDEDRDASDASEPEYDNDTYEAPGEDHDDSYEPPPSQQPRVFSSAPRLPRGEYLDSLRGRPQCPERPPKKPLRPGRAGKGLPPPPGAPSEDDEEDYINPDDDNYIEPDEHPPHRGRAVRELPRLPPQRPSSPDCYEVPNAETHLKPQPLPVLNRMCPAPIQPPPLTAKPSPRLPPRTPTPDQRVDDDEDEFDDDEYEVCDDSSSNKAPDHRPLPRPQPRERSPRPPIKPKIPAKPSFPEFEHDLGRTLAAMTEASSAPTKSFSLDLKRPKFAIPSFISHRLSDKEQPEVPENAREDEDKEAELLSLPWFADSCDRKMADDALFQTNQDGAFLVRRSSGHDSLQPFTLVVFYNGRVYNIPIRLLPGRQQYALGREKAGEEYFSSVPHIIEHHQRAPLVLIDGQSNAKEATRLRLPVRP